MYTVLNVTGGPNVGNIGHIFDSFETTCKLAAKFHFDAVNVDLDHKDSLSPADIKGLLTHYNLIPASAPCSAKLGGDFDEWEFEQSLLKFEKDAEALNFIGCNIVTYTLEPFSTKHTYSHYFKLMTRRLHKLKNILKDHSIKLAIEFIGASTRRMNVPHDFIHTIDGVRSLVAAADLDNHAGIVLDSYHWTASGGSILDIMHLDTDFILYVELNDGSARYDIYTLPENSRELPLTTGIVNAEGLLEELTRKHYNGPICIEPWNEKISQMPPEDAVKLIKNSIDDCMRIVTY